MADQNQKLLSHITGNCGKDAFAIDDTRKDDGSKIVKFSVGVTLQYGEQPITRWVNVAVFREDLQRQVLDKIKKGVKVAVEGKLTKRQWDGKDVFDMVATRIGLVEWFVRDQNTTFVPQGQRNEATEQAGW